MFGLDGIWHGHVLSKQAARTQKKARSRGEIQVVKSGAQGRQWADGQPQASCVRLNVSPLIPVPSKGSIREVRCGCPSRQRKSKAESGVSLPCGFALAGRRTQMRVPS